MKRKGIVMWESISQYRKVGNLLPIKLIKLLSEHCKPYCSIHIEMLPNLVPLRVGLGIRISRLIFPHAAPEVPGSLNSAWWHSGLWVVVSQSFHHIPSTYNYSTGVRFPLLSREEFLAPMTISSCN